VASRRSGKRDACLTTACRRTGGTVLVWCSVAQALLRGSAAPAAEAWALYRNELLWLRIG
jgi:hypothetical protein